MTVILPDIPGRVHGIKSEDPFVVQCDGCGTCITHDGRQALTTFFGTIFFSPADNYRRRMCAECWGKEGVTRDRGGRVS